MFFLAYPCSDVVCDYPLKEMLEFHRARDAEATILVTKVSVTRGTHVHKTVQSQRAPNSA
jgi:NDP-sugar pyrophosphorylase family protein